MITFSHPNLPTLRLRLDPTNVSWTYNMNTNPVPTMGGQVIQLLSINWNQMTLQGRFGKEGPHGKVIKNNKMIDNNANLWNYTRGTGGNNDFSIGLTQMTAFFQDYFSIATQGGDKRTVGNYVQQYMEVSYGSYLDQAETVWKVYPVDFPSYSRALDEFAPQWQVTFEIEEPDYAVSTTTAQQELDNLRSGPGYTIDNKFVDINVVGLNTAQAIKNSLAGNIAGQAQLIQGNPLSPLNDLSRGIYDPASVAAAVFNGASLPNNLIDPTNLALAQIALGGF